jgi:hypothetical protein
VDRARGAGFGLHLADVHHLSENVFQALGGHLVGDLAHGRGRRDRVDSRSLTHGIGHMRGGRVAVHGLHFFCHAHIPLSCDVKVWAVGSVFQHVDQNGYEGNLCAKNNAFIFIK